MGSPIPHQVSFPLTLRRHLEVQHEFGPVIDQRIRDTGRRFATACPDKRMM
jgi:hypothetical protein